MITNIKEVNQNLLTQGINKLPLDLMDIQGFKKSRNDKKLVLESENGEMTLALIKGSGLYHHVLVDETKEAILRLFDKINETEEKYQTSPVKLEAEVEQYSEQLPPLYKKLEENHWVVTKASNEAVVSEFMLTVHNEANKPNKPKLK